MSDQPSLRDELADQHGIDGQLAWRLLPLIDRYTVNWMTAATYANEENLDCDRRTFFKLQQQLLSAGLIETTGRVTDPPENADFPQILRESGHARRKLTPAGRALVHKHRDRKEARFQIRLSRRMRKLERKAASAAQRSGKREQAAAKARTPRMYRDFPQTTQRAWTAGEIDSAMESFEAAVQSTQGADPPK
jgi:hypothetical protein